MAVDVVDHVLVNAGVLDGELHARRDTRAVRARVGHVVRVAVDGAAHVLGNDGRAARHGVLKALHDEHASALAHDEAVAVLVPRPGRLLRLFVARGERAAGDEAAEANGDDGRLGAAADHHVGVAVADVRGGSMEGVV